MFDVNRCREMAIVMSSDVSLTIEETCDEIERLREGMPRWIAVQNEVKDLRKENQRLKGILDDNFSALRNRVEYLAAVNQAGIIGLAASRQEIVGLQKENHRLKGKLEEVNATADFEAVRSGGLFDEVKDLRKENHRLKQRPDLEKFLSVLPHTADGKLIIVGKTRVYFDDQDNWNHQSGIVSCLTICSTYDQSYVRVTIKKENRLAFRASVLLPECYGSEEAWAKGVSD